MWVEITVTAVTPIVTNALPMRIFDSDGSFESDGLFGKRVPICARFPVQIG